jgi:predicted XRE-type DNA-binding protein
MSLKTKNKDYTISSGNIFADLDFLSPEEWLTRAELALQINNIIKQKKLTRVAKAELLEIDQPEVSALSRGRVSDFSLERIFRFLNILDQDITIKVTPKTQTKEKAEVKVNLPKTKKPTMIKQPRADSSSTRALHAKKQNK